MGIVTIGCAGSLVATVTVALRTPNADGRNETPIAQVGLNAELSIVPGVAQEGPAPLLMTGESTKSAAFSPLTVTLLMARLWAPGFETTATVTAGPAVATGTLTKGLARV